MTDLSTTIEPKSDQLNADDLIAGDRTITITKVTKSDTPEQPVNIYFEGDKGKPFKPSKSMRRVLVQVWGKDGQQYVGKSMTLYRDPSVKFGGLEVGGIRISHMSHIDKEKTLVLTASKAQRKPFTVKPLKTTDKKPELSQETKKAGDEAAAKGVEAYKEWLSSLEASVKETVRPYHAEWTAKAKAVDAEQVEEMPI